MTTNINIKIIKRNGNHVDYDPTKIFEAVKKAYSSIRVVGEKELQQIEKVVKKVHADIIDLNTTDIPITIVQSFVENRLLDLGLIHVAEHYIAYRLQRDVDRYGYSDSIIVRLRLEQIR